jgi:hypothetical protein
MVSVAEALAARVHPAPTLMVTVVAFVAAVVDPLQPVKADPSPTVGLAGIPNPEANTTTIVSGPLEPPPALKPMVQVVSVAPPSMEDPLKVTPATPVMTMSAEGEPGLSTEVETENDVWGYDPAAAGLVMPEIERVSVAPKVQPDPLNVITTVWPLVDPVVGGVVQEVNPDPRLTVGEVGSVKPSAKVTEMVSVSISAVAGVKETVQVVPVAPATIEDPLKVTPETAAADAGAASSTRPTPPSTKPSAVAKERVLSNRPEPFRHGRPRLIFLDLCAIVVTPGLVHAPPGPNTEPPESPAGPPSVTSRSLNPPGSDHGL